MSEGRAGALCHQLALILAPPLFAATTFHTTFAPTNYLGLAVPILLAEAVVVLVAALCGMRPISALLRLSTASRVAVLIWLVAVTYVSLVSAPYPQAAQLILLTLLIHGLFALALNDRLSSYWADGGTRLLVASGWGAFLFCALVYALMVSVRDVDSFDWEHIGIGVSNVRQLGYFGLTCAAIGMGLMIARATGDGTANSLRNFAFATVGSAMCVWSGGRAVAGALTIVMVLTVAISPASERTRVALGVIGALVVGVALSLVWIPNELYGLPRILNFVGGFGDFNEYSSSRLIMWEQSLQYFLDRPLLGYGLGQFKFVVPSALNTFPQPHNAIVQFLFQWGLVGTGSILVLMSPALIKGVAVVRWGGDGAAWTAICLLAGHLSMSMLDGNLFHVYPVSVVVLALVVLASAHGAQPREAPSPG